MNVVVDASVAVKWFVHEELHTEALSLLDQQEALCAPDLLVPEVTNIAWKKVVRGEIESSQGHQIAMDIRTTVPALYPSTFLNVRAYNIAVTLNHPAYDCLYLQQCIRNADDVIEFSNGDDERRNHFLLWLAEKIRLREMTNEIFEVTPLDSLEESLIGSDEDAIYKLRTGKIEAIISRVIERNSDIVSAHI